MIDLIPTTADVRDAYSSESSDSTYANRMFDAWLARYKAKIVAKTEDRIIKLLEDEIKRLEGWTDYPAVNALMNVRAALIKGEK